MRIKKLFQNTTKVSPFAAPCLPPLARQPPAARVKRTKALFCFAIFALIALALFLPPSIAKADDTETAKSELNQSVLEQIDELDLAALQAYVDSLGVFSGESIAKRLFDYIGGEGIDYGGFLQGLSSVLFANVRKMLPSFACVTAVALLCGLLSSVKSRLIGGSTSQTVFLVSFAAALIPVLAILTECFGAAQKSIRSMQTQMQALFPLLLTLMAASGGSVSAAIYQPAVAFLSTAIVSIVSSVVFPLALTVVAFSLAGRLTPELKLNKFSAFFKSMNKWIIGVCISVFGMFFTVQGLASAAYDGITRRAAKYAIGTGIPIVGGFLSGGFDLAVAGSVLIKNSLGSLGIFLMVAVLSEPLISLIAANLFLRLTSAVTEPLGDSRISDFLGETADNLNYCTAGLLFVGFLYFVLIVLMICSSEVIF